MRRVRPAQVCETVLSHLSKNQKRPGGDYWNFFEELLRWQYFGCQRVASGSAAPAQKIVKNHLRLPPNFCARCLPRQPHL